MSSHVYMPSRAYDCIVKGLPPFKLCQLREYLCHFGLSPDISHLPWFALCMMLLVHIMKRIFSDLAQRRLHSEALMEKPDIVQNVSKESAFYGQTGILWCTKQTMVIQQNLGQAQPP